jgi:hypothetical protein
MMIFLANAGGQRCLLLRQAPLFAGIWEKNPTILTKNAKIGRIKKSRKYDILRKTAFFYKKIMKKWEKNIEKIMTRDYNIRMIIFLERK